MSDAIEFRGLVVHVLSAPPQGGAIFRVRSGRRSLKAIATYKQMCFAPKVGEYVHMTGQMAYDRVYGHQLALQAIHRCRPTGEDIVDVLMENEAFSYLSKKDVRRLWRVLGNRLYVALNERNAMMLDGLQLSATSVANLFAGWRRLTLIADVSKLMSELGLPSDCGEALAERYGDDVVSLIKANPYRLAPYAHWKLVDAVAQDRLHIDAKSDVRIDMACELALAQGLKRGYLAVRADFLTRRVSKLLGKHADASEAIQRAIARRTVEALVARDGAEVYLQTKAMFAIETALLARLGIPRQGQHMAIRALSESRPILRRVPAWLAHSVGQQNTLMVVPTISEKAHHKTINGSVYCASEVLLGMPALQGSVEFNTCWIRNASGYDTLTLHRIIKRFPKDANVVLEGDIGHLNPSGVGAPFSDLVRLFAPEESSSHCYLISTNGVAQCCLTEGLESLPLITQAEHPAASTTSGRTLGSDVIAQFYSQSATGNTAIVTGTWGLAKELNQVLHDERVALRRLQQQRCPSISLGDGATATIGDRVICREDFVEIGVIKGSRGEITEIYSAPRTTQNAHGVSEISLMQVELEAIGTIEVSRLMMDSFALGYAAPMHASLLSRWSRVVACADGRARHDIRWRRSALASAVEHCVFVDVPGNQISKAVEVGSSAGSRSGFGLTALNSR